MQQFSFNDLFIDLFESTLHVSGDKFAHLQEHFWLYIQLWYNASILLPTSDKVEMVTSDKVEMERHLNLVTGRQQYWCVVPKLHIQSKVFLKMGEFVAWNMHSRFKQINKKINKWKLLHLVGCLHRYPLKTLRVFLMRHITARPCCWFLPIHLQKFKVGSQKSVMSLWVQGRPTSDSDNVNSCLYPS